MDEYEDALSRASSAEIAAGQASVELLDGYVGEMLVDERIRRSSTESRGIGVITTALAAATLYLAVSNALNVTPLEGGAKAATVAALVFLGLAASSGLYTIAPRKETKGDPTDGDLRAVLVDTLHGPSSAPPEIQFEIAAVKIERLVEERRSNDLKASWLFLSVVLLTLGVLLLVGSLILSSPVAPTP